MGADGAFYRGHLRDVRLHPVADVLSSWVYEAEEEG